jgi:hypothetical protein
MLKRLYAWLTRDTRICIQCRAPYYRHDLRYFRECVLK